MDRKEKEQAVAELHGRLKDAKLAVLAGYRGMNVEKITALRNELRKTGTEFRVVKNTLLGIAAQGTDFAGLKDNLKGPLSLSMIGGDVAPPPKVLIDFARKTPSWISSSPGWTAGWSAGSWTSSPSCPAGRCFWPSFWGPSWRSRPSSSRC
ncbi:MAG: 50S ribosomal protein L10 [Syntrophaceae bacterium]|nr:50S ribosomal protein L10 [Syntrophaceae bacterium]